MATRQDEVIPDFLRMDDAIGSDPEAATLYGLNWARGPMQRKDRVLVVEGYFDVLSLHQAGFQETVATCGTALTPEHIKAIRPLTQTVVALLTSSRH